MKGIYLSGPVTGNEEAIHDFARAEALAEKLYPDALIFNPMKIAAGTPDLSYEEILDLDIMILDRFCDHILMIRGWWGSRGANRELGFAIAKGFHIDYESSSGVTPVRTTY